MALTVGFLGYGWAGRGHANALAKLPLIFPDAPAVERDVLVGRDEEALAEAVDQLGFERYTTEWEDVIDEVDVLYNLWPNSLHVEPSIAALEEGVHVFCEKPLAATLDGAERMAAAAEASEAVAGINFSSRFAPEVQYAKGLIDDGVIGEIRQFHADIKSGGWMDPELPHAWWNSKELTGSSALNNLGSHTIDLARFLAGEQAGEITWVNGQLQTFVDERPVEGGGTAPVDTDDAYHAHAEFENGAMGRFGGSLVAGGHNFDQAIDIYGSEGSLRVRFSFEHGATLELFRQGEDSTFQTVPVLSDPEPYIDPWWQFLPLFDGVDYFLLANHAFLRAIEEGGRHETTFEDGLAVQQVTDAIERSHHVGERMRIA